MIKQSFIILTLILLNSCTIVYRAVRYGSEDIDDYKIFPSYKFNENQVKHSFPLKENCLIDTIDINWKYKNSVYHNLDSLLAETTTRSLLIIQHDSIIYENYFNGYSKGNISQVFSVSKSVTSLLIGIALEEEYISDINDPVTKYIPELKTTDPLYKELTINNLLDMRSGLKFNESYAFNPFSKIAHLYYGTNQLGLSKKMHFECAPGIKHEYQSISTTLLGLVIEKATGETLAKYFEEKVWIPLEMEYNGGWSLDDNKHQSTKAFGGLYISAIDLAKIGQLYLNGGKYKNKQIVSEKWIKATLTPHIDNEGYQKQWYSFCGNGTDTSGNKYFCDSITAINVWKEKYAEKYPNYNIVKINKSDYTKKEQKKYWKYNGESYWNLRLYTNQYYALGLYGQIMFINPKKKTIIIRIGDYQRLNYHALVYKIDTAI